MLHQDPTFFGTGAFFGNQQKQEQAIARVRNWPARGFCRHKMAEGAKRNFLAILTETVSQEEAYALMQLWYNIPQLATDRMLAAYNFGDEKHPATCAYRIITAIPLGANLEELTDTSVDYLEAVSQPEAKTWRDILRLLLPTRQRWRQVPRDQALIEELAQLPKAAQPAAPPIQWRRKE
jgi:hypothetical protein